MKNTSQITLNKITQFNEKNYATQDNKPENVFDSLMEILKLQLAKLSTFFTDKFSNTARGDNSLKKYQEERKIGFSTLPCDLDPLGKPRKLTKLLQFL